MALRLYYEFDTLHDYLGGTGLSVYRVEIHDANYTGDAVEVHPSSDGFILKYDGKDENLFQPIMGSSVKINIQHSDATEDDINDFADDLATGNEGDFTIAIYIDPDGDNDLYWCGVILPEQVVLPDTGAQSLDITAADDLANLKAIDYTDDGTPYEGVESLLKHAINCLLKTRAVAYWSDADKFVEYATWIRYVNDLSQVQDPWTYTGFLHEEMNDTAQTGVKKYKSAYEILEACCFVLHCTIQLDHGRWRILPRQVYRSGTAFILWTPYKKDATSWGSAYTDLTLFKTIANTGSNVHRLGGGQFGYLNAVRSVTLEYEYRGAVPIINQATYTEADFDTTVMTSSAYIVPSGQPITFYCTYQITQAADGTRTGNARALRYKFTVRLKCGTFYAERQGIVGFGSTSITLDSGASVSVFVPQYGGQLWSTDSANRYDFFTTPVNAFDGDYQSGTIVFVTAGMPSDSTGVEVTIFVEAFEADGDTSGTITSDALADAVIQVSSVKAWISDGTDSTTDTLLWLAEVDNGARDVLELDATILGDNISDEATRGSLRLVSDDSYTGARWIYASVGTLRPLHDQLIRRYLAQHQNTTRTFKTKFVFNHQISPVGVYYYELRGYVPFTFSHNAGKGEFEVEMFVPQVNDADLTVNDPVGLSQGDGLIPSGTGSGVGVGIGAGIVADNTQAALTAVSKALVQTFQTSATTSSTSEVFIPWVAGATPTASLDSTNQFVTPYAMEFVKVIVNTSGGGGSTTITLYNNAAGITTETVSISADTPTEFNLEDNSPNTIISGRLFAIGYNATTAPGDIMLTLVVRPL